jgi:hypothetical protein
VSAVHTHSLDFSVWMNRVHQNRYRSTNKWLSVEAESAALCLRLLLSSTGGKRHRRTLSCVHSDV